MPIPIKVVQPSYYGAFHCVGPDCEDSCCRGMGVAVDRDSFVRYQACDDPELRPIFDAHLRKANRPAHDAAFAMIGSKDGKCPFWNEDRLCRIQTMLGEDQLSRTCATYPRILNTVDSVVERSLYLSCPEAARLILLDPEPICFVETEQPEPYRFSGFPTMSTSGEAADDQPYRHAAEIRKFCLALLQNRSYALWKRLIILGGFCEQLEALCGAGCQRAAPDLIASYNDQIAARGFDCALDGVAASPAFQIETVVKIVEARIESGPVGTRFLECYDMFTTGLDLAGGAGREARAERYRGALRQHYRALMATRGHMLEHAAVSHVFGSLFPLGPQTGVYVESQTLFDNFVILAIHYIILRTLGVGMAGCQECELSDGHLVKLIQSYSRDFEDDRPFLKRVRKSLADAGVDSMPILAILLKDGPD